MFLRTIAAMNTRFSFLLPGIDDQEGEAIGSEIADLVASYERVMSRFSDEAELARVNRGVGCAPASVSETLWTILSDCREHWIRTGGAFDITLGSVNDNWRGDRGCGRGGWDQVRLESEGRCVAFRMPGIRLDLGGIGKGIALRGVHHLLRSRGIENAVLSFGESSILALGRKPDGEAWQIGVCDLFDQDQTVHNFALCGESLSTSGAAGLEHLVDPRTKRAVGTNRQLTVACACPVDAEVLSTSLIVSPPAARAAILAAYSPARAVEFGWFREGEGWRRQKVWEHAA